mgnify:CR=1 FL=1
MQLIRNIIVWILTWEARLVLKRYRPRVIAVTGNVGKTTTKDAIFAALSEHLYARKSQKSFNSEIGVPLTILGLENAWHNPFHWLFNIARGLYLVVVKQEYPQWLILEVGADRPGDIRSIAKWLRPDIAIITGVPEIPVHVEYFKSPEALLREKRALAEHLKPGGKLILNCDDPRMREVQSDFRGASVSYGFEPFNEYAAEMSEILYDDDGCPAGMRFRLQHGGSSVPVAILGALGRPRIYGALAALAVADVCGIDIISAAASLSTWEPPSGRMRILEGIRGSIIIDDTYNSSPAAVLSALDTVKELHAKRKFAILGDMLELGRYSIEAHRTVGERARECINFLITVGFRARAIGEAALDSGMRDEKIREYEFGESGRAGAELAVDIKKGDVILVKGSQSMRMERAVYELMAHPENAKELLVRQDDEWLAKS